MKLLSVVVLVLTYFIQGSLQRPVSKHAEIKKLIKTDQCTATLNHESIEHKMTLMSDGNISWMCCGCNPGYYVEEICKTSENVSSTKCQPCAPGTYIQEYAHGRRNCIIDSLTSCPPDRVHVPGNTREPSRCDCPWGFHATHGGDCQLHTPCPPGEGVLIAASSFRDTTCEKCRHGYHSPNSSPTETCLPISVSFVTTKNTSMAENEKATKQTTSKVVVRAEDKKEMNNAKENSNVEGGQASITVLVLVIVFAVVFVPFATLLIQWGLKHYNVKSLQFQHDEEKNPKPPDVSGINTEERVPLVRTGHVEQEDSSSFPDTSVTSSMTTMSKNEPSCAIGNEQQTSSSAINIHPEVGSSNDQQHVMSSSRGFATASESTPKLVSTVVCQDGANGLKTEAIPFVDTPRSSGLAPQRRNQSMAASNSSSNIPSQSNKFTALPMPAVYDEIMKKMRNIVSKIILVKEVNPFIRHFFRGPGSQQYIGDLENNYKFTSERFIEAFIELKKQGRNFFNPELIYKYLNDNNRALADDVHDLMLEWQASTRDDSKNAACVANNQCD